MINIRYKYHAAKTAYMGVCCVYIHIYIYIYRNICANIYIYIYIYILVCIKRYMILR